MVKNHCIRTQTLACGHDMEQVEGREVHWFHRLWKGGQEKGK